MVEDDALKNKTGEWFFKRHEDGLRAFLVPKIPDCIETYHLTLLTFIWSFLIIFSFYCGENYLWFVPLLVFAQYITDILDGAVGRVRETGLVRWGFYADHFLDFVFMTSLVAGYGILLGFNIWIFVIYAVMSGFMIHTFLLVAANNAFNISFLGIGPTELRVIFILFHLFFVYFKVNLVVFLPYMAFVAVALMFLAFFLSQKKLWQIDMGNKKQTEHNLRMR